VTGLLVWGVAGEGCVTGSIRGVAGRMASPGVAGAWHPALLGGRGRHHRRRRSHRGRTVWRYNVLCWW